MKNRILSILTAIAVAASLSACRADDTGQSPPLIDSVITVVEEAAEPIEMKIIEPPEEGWTVEKLADTIRFNGETIQLPFTVDNLGGEYSIDESERYFIDGSAGAALKYNNKRLCTVSFNNCNVEDNLYEVEVSGIVLSTLSVNEDVSDCITINGLSLNDNKSNVISCLGNYSQENDEIWIYNVQNSNNCLMTIHFDDNDKVTDIFLHM